MAGSDRDGDRERALAAALVQIERQFGKGSVMRLGDEVGRLPWRRSRPARSRSTWPWASAACRAAASSRYTAPKVRARRAAPIHAIANAQKSGGIAAFIDAEHALDPGYAQKLGVDTDALLVSQPDTGEQALEIADMLIRSGAIGIVVIDFGAPRLVPRAEIEGEMGDSHVGLQARLMSQALRKLTGAISQTKTTVIFINQLREKIGVMFGCMSYTTRVTLADGSQEKIGKIVNQRMPVRVLSYDPDTGTTAPRRVTGWFNNGPADKFLQFTVAKSGGQPKGPVRCHREPPHPDPRRLAPGRRTDPRGQGHRRGAGRAAGVRTCRAASGPGEGHGHLREAADAIDEPLRYRGRGAA